jgi:hypothetical protein
VDEQSLGPEDRVDKRGFADVRPPDHGHPEPPSGARLSLGGGSRAGSFQKLGYAAPMLGRNRKHRRKAEGVELAGIGFQGRPVHLVDHEENRPAGASQNRRRLAVERGQPGPPVHHKEDEVRFFDRR